MNSATIVFPHQLFEINPAIAPGRTVYLVEESLFFNQYQFHKQKLAFHRASMKSYETFLTSNGAKVVYIEAGDELSNTRTLIQNLMEGGVNQIHYCDVADNWLEKRIRTAAVNVQLFEHETPLFINSRADLLTYFNGRKHYFQTDFYLQQRKRLGILVDEDMKPTGGKWSFDAENRLKYPKAKIPPTVVFPTENENVIEAREYVKMNYFNNYGQLNDEFSLPVTHTASRE